MKNKYTNVRNPRTNTMAILFVIVLAIGVMGTLVACSNKTQQTPVYRTGIITKDTTLYREVSYNTKIVVDKIDIYKNDLVYVIYQDATGYYVQMPLLQYPPIEGFIPLDTVSFDESLFSTANHGVLDNATLYNTPDLNDIYDTVSSAVSINERRNDGWVLCGLTGGAEAKWVEENKIIYIVERDQTSASE